MAYLVLQVVVMGEGVQEEMMCQGRSVLFIRLVWDTATYWTVRRVMKCLCGNQCGEQVEYIVI